MFKTENEPEKIPFAFYYGLYLQRPQSLSLPISSYIDFLKV